MDWQKCSGIKRSYLGLFWQNPRVKSKSYKLLPYLIKAI
ncbi:hypothetical protein SD15574_1663 [Shigella dysenteriae 155-74]|nr:hypothetical protein Sd1012_2115 [Shigella dysenteriae 1012]EGI99761.1 hypothetical protein SD15574_1663 [Shigella dysenteriae 155-74]EIQ31496.1 hypothetical protein SB96558_1706 [Shigella boydii 965-58]VDG84093.1 Uncharacterised protein [Shigella dysenteriae]